MKAIVCGLGHVGIVSAAGLLRDGHQVIGIDPAPGLSAALARGVVPFREPGVDELIHEGLATSRLSLASDLSTAIDADIVFVCVGTHGTESESLDLSQVRTLARELGKTLSLRPAWLPALLVVFRSTLLPGSMTGSVLPEMTAAAGEPPGPRYEVVYSPEFSREGSALRDWSSPSRIVIGERHPGAASPFLERLQTAPAPVFAVPYQIAELAKLADNAFHALKVCFANEIGRLAVAAGIPVRSWSEIFLADTKLNTGPAYLTPGGPFGGPCLPKDVAALATHFAGMGIAAPLMGNILASNQAHADFLLTRIIGEVAPNAAILLVGLSFKPGTDDLRSSPLARLADQLIERGYQLAIFDPEVEATAMSGGARRFADRLLPAMPAGRHWDLVLIGKDFPAVDAALPPAAPRFRLDRL